MPRGDQLSRQWRLIQLIDRPQGITVDDAADELTCTVRTIWRDLGVLQQAGFPLYTERAADGNRGVWRVTEAFKRALPLKLTLGELVALLMSRELLTPLGASVLGPEVASAFDKIQGALSRDALQLVEQMRDRLGVRGAGAKLQAPAAEHLPRIHTALAERRTLRTRYYSAGRDREDVREIDPYHLTLHNGGLYLVAHCHLRDAVRTFAVERMRTVEPTRRRFVVPSSFDAAKYLEGVWGILRGDLVSCGWSSRAAGALHPRAAVAPLAATARPAGRAGGVDATRGRHAGSAAMDPGVPGTGGGDRAARAAGGTESGSRGVARQLAPARLPLAPAPAAARPRPTALSRKASS